MKKVWMVVFLVLILVRLETGSVLGQTAPLRLDELQFLRHGEQRTVSVRFSDPPDSVKSFVLSSPVRLIIDVKRPVQQLSSASYVVDDELLQRVRVGPHPQYTRFVFDLAGKHMPQFVVEQNGEQVTAIFGEATGQSSQEYTQLLFSRTSKTRVARSTPQRSVSIPTPASTPPPVPAPASIAPNLALQSPPSSQSLSLEARHHMEQGQRLYDRGQVDEAIAEWQKTIRLAPHAGRAHHLLGVALRDQGYHTKALSSFQEAVRLEPDNATAHVHLGRTLEYTGDPQGARVAYHTALEIVPSAAYVHNRLGHLLAAEGDWPGAAKEWQETVQLAPDYAYAHTNLGEAFEKMNKRDDALDSYERALSMCAQFAATLEKMGKKDQAAIFCSEVRKSVTRLRNES